MRIENNAENPAKPRTCTAKRKDGKPCASTAVMANGKCRMHGGGTGRPVTNGRYARVAKGALARHLAMIDPSKIADMTSEIGLGQALIEMRLEDAETISADVASELIALADKINRMQDRMIRSRNETALTAAEVKILEIGILGLIDEFIPDPDRKRAFLARLAKIIPGRVDSAG